MTDGDANLPKPVRRSESAAWVGLFLIIGVVAVLAVLFAMTEPAMFRGRYIITTKMSNALGVRRGDAVQMRGVPIGRVLTEKMDEVGGKIAGVALRLEIEGEYRIPKDSHVELKSGGFISGMVVVMMPGQASEYLKDGDVIPGISPKDLGDQMAALSEKLDVTLARVQEVLNEATVKNVHASTADLAQTMRALNETVSKERESLHTLMTSLNRSSASVEKLAGAPELDRSVKRVDDITARMTEVSTSLQNSSKSLETLATRLEKGEGSLGKAVQDPALYDNLNEAARNVSQATTNLNKLTEEIRRNPKKYLKLSVF
jgi:phospholipid/cholesterol/gamma-HCH transport system substrate-binding protein